MSTAERNGHALMIREAADVSLALGLSVLPPAQDGTKRPCPDPVTGRGEWKDYQSRRASAEQLAAWYGPCTGLGLVCGAISGGLEVLDFDHRGTYERYRKAAEALGLGGLVDRVEAGYLEETPGDGVHWLYVCGEVRECTKLARRHKTADELTGDDLAAIEAAKSKGKALKPVKTLIETKAEGGYIVVAPSFGKVHPSGNPYRLVRGGLKSIVTLTPAERELLWGLARTFDALPAPDRGEPHAKEGQAGGWPDTLSPGDDYNARARWPEILVGWTVAYRDGDTEYWRRPGKTVGQSATVNRGGSDRLFVFSSSTEFETKTPYSKFAAFALMEHRGDFKAAALDLIAKGYGLHKRWVRGETGYVLQTFPNPCPPGQRIAKPGDPPPVDFDGFSGEPPEPEPWPPLRLGELPPVPDFPLGVLPDDVSRLASEAAGAVGCNPGMVAAPMLATAAGLIGRSASLLLGANWFAQPCLFQVNVALPGDGKSPALEYAAAPSDEFEEALAETFKSEKQSYREALRGGKDKAKKGGGDGPPDPPVPRRVRIDDVTLESLFLVMADNGRGVLMVRDELSSLILGLNQYKGGGGNDRPNLMKVWSGKSVTIDRVRNELREPVRIPHPSLSISGNLPPAMLAEMVSRRGDDGFLDRWLFVYPDRRPKLKSSQRRPVSKEAARRWSDAARALYGRSMDTGEGGAHPHVIFFGNAGKAEFDRLHDAHVDEVNAPDFPDNLRGPWSKLEEYAGRLCLVLTLLRRAADPTADPDVLPMAGVRDARDAWTLVGYFKAHHRRVRAYLEGRGLGGAPEGVKLILRWLRNHPDVTSFAERDLARNHPFFYEDPAELEDALLWLAQRNAVRPSAPHEEAKGKRGRKPSPAWDVHPSLRPRTIDGIAKKAPPGAPGDPGETNSGNSVNCAATPDKEDHTEPDREVFEL